MQTIVPFACFLSMIRPPGVQFENSLLQIAPVDKAKCPYVKDHNDIAFQLYTRHNPTTYQELVINDDETLFASHIDWHAPTVIYFHAFMEMPDEGSGLMVREAYILRGDTNVIMVDARRLEAGPWYFTAAENTWFIGRFAAQFIDYLVSRGLDMSRTHLIGHSLGAQAAGVAGAAIKSGKVARITGLDPALPLFHGLPPEQQLDASDAHFVDVIHTDAGIFGVNRPVGHADFYPNGGISPQPGCELEVVIPQQLLLNNCDRNAKPEGLFAFYLKPNPKRKASRLKLERRIEKLFSYIQSVKEADFGKKKVHKTASMNIGNDAGFRMNNNQEKFEKAETLIGEGEDKTEFRRNNKNLESDSGETNNGQDMNSERTETLTRKAEGETDVTSTGFDINNTDFRKLDNDSTIDEIIDNSKIKPVETINKGHKYKQHVIATENKAIPIINKEENIQVKTRKIDDGRDIVIEDQEMTDSILRPHVLKPFTNVQTPDSESKLNSQDVVMTEKLLPWNNRNIDGHLTMMEDQEMTDSILRPHIIELIPNTQGLINTESQDKVMKKKLSSTDVESLGEINFNHTQEATVKMDKIALHSDKIKNHFIHNLESLVQETARKSNIENKDDETEGKNYESPPWIIDGSVEPLSEILNQESTQKSHIVKRQKRFLNFFKPSEAAEQNNFLFRMLDFLLKNRKHALPVYTVMREINTLVKSANGELNHSTKERNNYIGAPPPSVIPLTYDLQIGNENRIVAFMKKLVGLKPRGDKLLISGK